jgi:hypothetical protein
VSHLRFSSAPDAVQRTAILDIVRQSPVLMRTLTLARSMDLPDWWLVSGAIYGQVWNHLTGRAEMHGVKDLDLFYFDPDTSYEAEDRQIRRAAALFPPSPPVELRNQARVPLWYPDHFGRPYPPIATSAEAIARFACTTHCVGLQLRMNDEITLCAPYGLQAIFAFQLVPNPVMDNRATHAAKAERQQRHWPELTVIPWPDA